MEIAIRVDASIWIGTGHVIRCLNLAEKLRQYRMKCTFICKEHNGNLISKIEERGFDTFIIPAPAHNANLFYEDEQDWLDGKQYDDALICAHLFKQSNYVPDLLIIDHYAIDIEWERIIKLDFPETLIVIIDDLCNRAHECNVLIDTTLGRGKEDYKKLIPPYCQTYFGTKYSLIREDFLKLRHSAKLRRGDTITPETLLITMGGVDAKNITKKILQAINKTFANELKKITVILGKHCPHIEEIKSIANKMQCKTTVMVDVANMPELMCNHDASIGALGGTTWERCVLGLPAINISIANNQHSIVDKLKQKGFLTLSDTNFTASDIANAWNQLKDNYHLLSQKAFTLCDGKGLERLVEKVIMIPNKKDDYESIT